MPIRVPGSEMSVLETAQRAPWRAVNGTRSPVLVTRMVVVWGHKKIWVGRWGVTE